MLEKLILHHFEQVAQKQTALATVSFPTFLHHTIPSFKGKLTWKGNPYFQLQSGFEVCQQQRQTTKTVHFCCTSLPLRLKHFGDYFRAFTLFTFRGTRKKNRK